MPEDEHVRTRGNHTDGSPYVLRPDRLTQPGRLPILRAVYSAVV